MAVNPNCSIDGDDCTDGGKISRGMCRRHHERDRLHGDPLRVRVFPTECALVADGNCTPPGGKIIKGLCVRHYGRQYLYGSPTGGSSYRAARGQAATECSISNEDCSPPGGRIVASLCSLHYYRKRELGDPLAPPRKRGGGPGRKRKSRPSKHREFVLLACEYDSDDCLIWPYAVGAKGYGAARWEGRTYTAHRIVLILTQGQPPAHGMQAAHAPGVCHQRRCVNPRHIRWATPEENQADRVIDGTSNRGERSATAILNRWQVYEIRTDCRPDDVIALDYGVTGGCIRNVKERRTWAWLD